jgi:hypothetical protein
LGYAGGHRHIGLPQLASLAQRPERSTDAVVIHRRIIASGTYPAITRS